VPAGCHPPHRSHMTLLPRLALHSYTPWLSKLSVCHDRSARHLHREDRTLKGRDRTLSVKKIERNVQEAV
jgi:hypothetical protein